MILRSNNFTTHFGEPGCAYTFTSLFSVFVSVLVVFRNELSVLVMNLTRIYTTYNPTENDGIVAVRGRIAPVHLGE